MKFYKPLFSIILILIQLILSIIGHFNHIDAIRKMKETNPGLHELINYSTTYEALFLFVLIIGFYEILTKQKWLKISIKVLLFCIIIGTQFSGLIPINEFYYGVYNTAWFSAAVAFFLVLIKIGSYYDKKSKLN